MSDICGGASLRPARPGDAEDLFHIYLENYQEILGLEDPREMQEYDRRLYGPQYKFLSPANLDAWIRAAPRGSGIIVAEAGGAPVGFVVYHGAPGCYIEELHVRRECRGRGIGRMLHEAALQVLAGSGCIIVKAEAHRRSIGFLEALGYVPVHVEEEPYMGRLQYSVLVRGARSGLDAKLRSAILLACRGDPRGGKAARDALAWIRKASYKGPANIVAAARSLDRGRLRELLEAAGSRLAAACAGAGEDAS